MSGLMVVAAVMHAPMVRRRNDGPGSWARLDREQTGAGDGHPAGRHQRPKKQRQGQEEKEGKVGPPGHRRSL
jgi:hypothetical protein